MISKYLNKIYTGSSSTSRSESTKTAKPSQTYSMMIIKGLIAVFIITALIYIMVMVTTTSSPTPSSPDGITETKFSPFNLVAYGENDIFVDSGVMSDGKGALTAESVSASSFTADTFLVNNTLTTPNFTDGTLTIADGKVTGITGITLNSSFGEGYLRADSKGNITTYDDNIIAGDVNSTGTPVNNEIAVFEGADSKTIKGSDVFISSGNITGVNLLTANTLRMTTGASDGFIAVSNSGTLTWQNPSFGNIQSTGSFAANELMTFTSNAGTTIQAVNGVTLSSGTLSGLSQLVTTSFQLTTSAAVNRVLTSDASGNGTWQDISNPGSLTGTDPGAAVGDVVSIDSSGNPQVGYEDGRSVTTLPEEDGGTQTLYSSDYAHFSDVLGVYVCIATVAVGSVTVGDVIAYRLDSGVFTAPVVLDANTSEQVRIIAVSATQAVALWGRDTGAVYVNTIDLTGSNFTPGTPTLVSAVTSTHNASTQNLALARRTSGAERGLIVVHNASAVERVEYELSGATFTFSLAATTAATTPRHLDVVGFDDHYVYTYKEGDTGGNPHFVLVQTSAAADAALSGGAAPAVDSDVAMTSPDKFATGQGFLTAISTTHAVYLSPAINGVKTVTEALVITQDGSTMTVPAGTASVNIGNGIGGTIQGQAAHFTGGIMTTLISTGYELVLTSFSVSGTTVTDESIWPLPGNWSSTTGRVGRNPFSVATDTKTFFVGVENTSAFSGYFYIDSNGNFTFDATKGCLPVGVVTNLSPFTYIVTGAATLSGLTTGYYYANPDGSMSKLAWSGVGNYSMAAKPQIGFASSATNLIMY